MTLDRTQPARPAGPCPPAARLAQLAAALVATALIAPALPAVPAAAAAPARDDHPLAVRPLLEGSAFDAAVPRPGDILGYPIGSRAATHAEIVRVFEALAAASPLAELRDHGETHEHRRLIHLVVSSRETLAHLDSVRAGLHRLADPRGLDGKLQRQLVDRLPAVCWLGYSIHGDELSGSDAAMLVAYRLVAGTDSLAQALRDRLIIILDPMENPDGRDRFIQMTRQWAGDRPSPDLQSLQHAGFWPWGRTNHYLFDLNRDWFALVHPESRGRVPVIAAWQPQLMVDAHEMGSFDSFLFSPPREPFNPYITPALEKWWDVFAGDLASAFDRAGWSYYTRAWHEEWFPGYGSSWSCYLGAVGILYEQARVHGSLVKRPDATVLTYSETVHHQLVASLANLETAARNRRALLADFVREKRRALGRRGAYLFLEGDHPQRAARLARTLFMQGIEVQRLRTALRASGALAEARDLRGQPLGERELPAGTYVVNRSQPLSPLADAILDPDPRMSNAFLETELHELRKHKRSRLYEVTSWSLLDAYGLEAYVAPQAITGFVEPLSPAAPGGAGADTAAAGAALIENPGARFGYLIDWRQDAAAVALVRLLERGLEVHAARKDFEIGGQSYPRGTLLLRRSDNARGLDAAVEAVARETGARFTGTSTALADDGPDLGGNDFRRLREPRIALVAGNPVSYSSLGPLWYLLDQEIAARVSLLDLARLGRYDLTKYNVLVLPDLWGSANEFARGLGEGGVDELREWIEAGGTLVGIGSGAVFAADEARQLSQVRLRRNVLDGLDAYQASLERELEALSVPEIDSLAIWEGPRAQSGDETQPPPGAAAPDSTRAASPGAGTVAAAGAEPDSTTAGAPGAEPGSEERQRTDALQRRMRPRGATLVAELDPEHWLTAGLGAWVPVNLDGSIALMSKDPVVTPARLAAAADLRIGGLLWPEARTRWARTAYLTRERKGRGQIILFADQPNRRAYWHGSERLLVNALLLGPGMGTSTPAPW